WGSGALDSNGQTIGRDSKVDIMENYTEAEVEVLEAYGIDLWVESFPQPEELGQPPHGRAWEYVIPTSSDVTIIQQKADDLTTQKITEAILASPEDFDAIYDDMVAQLEAMNIKEAESQMTKITT